MVTIQNTITTTAQMMIPRIMGAKLIYFSVLKFLIISIACLLISENLFFLETVFKETGRFKLEL